MDKQAKSNLNALNLTSQSSQSIKDLSKHITTVKKGIKTFKQIRTRYKLVTRGISKFYGKRKARNEVYKYNQSIKALQSYHLNVAPVMDWTQMARLAPPFIKEDGGINERKALHALFHYRPSFIERLFPYFQTRKRNRLELNIGIAQERDNKLYQEWEQKKALAIGILELSPDITIKWLEKQQIYGEIENLNERIHYNVTEKGLQINYRVLSIDTMPSTVKVLTGTGKLSQRQMGKAVYYRLYQDYICSALLRIARDMFALLPIKHIYLHAITTDSSSVTGNSKESVILSVLINETDFHHINWDNIDPSDCISSFKHKMKFLVTSGFKEVSRL